MKLTTSFHKEQIYCRNDHEFHPYSNTNIELCDLVLVMILQPNLFKFIPSSDSINIILGYNSLGAFSKKGFKARGSAFSISIFSKCICCVLYSVLTSFFRYSYYLSEL